MLIQCYIEKIIIDIINEVDLACWAVYLNDGGKYIMALAKIYCVDLLNRQGKNITTVQLQRPF